MTNSLHALTLVMVTSILLSACNDSNHKPTNVLITHDSDMDKAQGIWHKKAYGEVIGIDNGRVKRYEFNTTTCSLVWDTSYQGMIQEHIDSLELKNQSLLAITEKGRPIADTFTKIAELPASCKNPLTAEQTTTPTKVFEYFWHTFNDYYAFFDLRKVDWQKQYEIHAPLIHDGMSDETLFAVLSNMVSPLQDAHISVDSDFKSFTTFKPAPMLRSAEAVAKSDLQSGVEPDTEKVVWHMLKEAEQITTNYVTEQSFKSFPTEGDSKTLLWGITPDNVGILVINNMAKFHKNPEASEVQHLQAAETIIDAILAELKGTDGLIIDIRHNLGGDLFIAQAIANRFADSDQLVAKWQAKNRSGLGYATTLSLSRHMNAYTKPVYLLTSQLTMSAGEALGLMMKQLPQVTHVGEQTQGIFSAATGFRLPNGWVISLSNEVFSNASGENFEQRGLQPDRTIPAFSSLDYQLQRFQTYDYALKAMGKETLVQLDVTEFEKQAKQLITQAGLPGLAVAVVKNGQVKYAKGFGIADEQNTPVSANTPFYLASVSKTLVGATLAHAVSHKTIALDDEVAPLLPFDIDEGAAPQATITFRQLITHTSGIMDRDSTYLCSYYQHESKKNMSDVFQLPLACNDEITPDLPLFLKDYLNHSGRYYTKSNFTSYYGFATGTVYSYSNIATALAAFALERKSQTPFVELVKNYLFTPLQMNNSSWAIGKPAANVATRFKYNLKTAEPYALPSYGAITYADGSAISSVNDLARFLIASLNKGKINQQQMLPESAVTAMLSPQTKLPVPSRDIGYFWQLDGSYIHHDGSDPGVMSQIIGDLNSKNGIVLLSNGDDTHAPHDKAFKAIQHLALQLAHSN